jgi:hypothetical protein
MILPEVLISQRWGSAESATKTNGSEMGTVAVSETRMTINVLVTLVVTFLLATGALLVLAGGSLDQSIVAGALATAAAFVNLVRRPPGDVKSS